MKYLLELAYKGTQYSGWQKQINAPSIQEVLESAMQKMLHQKVNCIGCGRTDAGVHAHQFYCHFVYNKEIKFDVVQRLNKMLPDDISIYNCSEVDKEFHAQHSAFSRAYTYSIHLKKNPFLSEISTFYEPHGLEIKKMKDATVLIKNATDFKAFCKQPRVYKSSVCNIMSAQLSYLEKENKINIHIKSNRFLRGMMRLLVGNMLEVGYGKLSIQAFEAALQNGTSLPFYKAAYPQGLSLTEVIY